MSDLISRQAAIGEVKKHYRAYDNDLLELIAFDIERLPPAQPEEAIPVSWIEARIERFKAEDNVFCGLTANIMHVMLNEWKKEQEGETT